MNKMDKYALAGVNIDAGNKLVERIKPLAKATNRLGVMGGIGGFGGIFDPKAAGYKDPLIISATDGVGTKLKIAQMLNKHDTIGQDLVAMCVNDLIVQGAEPLFFLDYFACGKLEIDTAEQVIKGIADGCNLAGCALLGGETAEMPSMYGEGEYDLAGFAVGAVERQELLPRSDLMEGDIILGLASNGIHSNGYSLVRKIIQDKGYSYQDKASFDDATLGDAFLKPTRIYAKQVLAAIKEGGIKALAHITGGGLTENLPRVIPDNLACEIFLESWQMPKIFAWLAAEGDISQEDMLRTFNCGIGMALICDAEQADDVAHFLYGMGENVYRIGKISKKSNDAVKYI